MRILTTLMQLIFPPRSTQLLVRKCSAEDITKRYIKQKIASDLYALSFFSDPAIRACVHELKYHSNKKATSLLAPLLLRFIQEQRYTNVTLLPIPLARKRYRERGYNQTLRLAQAVAQSMPDLNIQKDVLSRVKDAAHQTDLPREERLTNVKDVFAISKKVRELHDSCVIILDDVVTTGATLHEAKATLSPHINAHIICVAIAH